MGLLSFGLRFVAIVAFVIVAIAVVGFIIVVKHRRFRAEDAENTIAPCPNIPLRSVEPYSYPVPGTYMPSAPQPAATTATQVQQWSEIQRASQNVQEYPVKMVCVILI